MAFPSHVVVVVQYSGRVVIAALPSFFSGVFETNAIFTHHQLNHGLNLAFRLYFRLLLIIFANRWQLLNLLFATIFLLFDQSNHALPILFYPLATGLLWWLGP